MNNAHIVVAGTDAVGCVGGIAARAAQALAASGWQADTVELAGGALPGNAQREADDVERCDLLVLVFPILWSAAPAALQYWIERVFSRELRCAGTPMNARGCMHGRNAIAVVVLDDIESIDCRDGVETAVVGMLGPLLGGTLDYLGFNVLRPHVIAGTRNMPEPEMAVVQNEAGAVFANLKRRARFHGLMRSGDRALPCAMC